MNIELLEYKLIECFRIFVRVFFFVVKVIRGREMVVLDFMWGYLFLGFLVDLNFNIFRSGSWILYIIIFF